MELSTEQILILLSIIAFAQTSGLALFGALKNLKKK
jgi:hypothetical protein